MRSAHGSGTTCPIRVKCEGGGLPGHDTGDGEVMCTMCGGLFEWRDGDVPYHEREDVLAMLDRGDCG